MHFRGPALLLLGMAVLAIALLAMYSGARRPLSSAEVDAYVARIEAQTQVPGGRHDIAALRNFLEADDGQPFYTVNLYKFRDRAHYLDGRQNSVGGRQDSEPGARAFERFSEVMIGLLARRWSHPIFGSDWSDSATSAWDRIVIVRYRSRRDIAEIFADPAFADASAHKWAALADHSRMLVQGLHIPELFVPATIVLLFSGVIALRPRLRARRTNADLDARGHGTSLPRA